MALETLCASASTAVWGYLDSRGAGHTTHRLREYPNLRCLPVRGPDPTTTDLTRVRVSFVPWPWGPVDCGLERARAWQWPAASSYARCGDPSTPTARNDTVPDFSAAVTSTTAVAAPPSLEAVGTSDLAACFFVGLHSAACASCVTCRLRTGRASTRGV